MAATSSAEPPLRRSARNLKRQNDVNKEESSGESPGYLPTTTAAVKRAGKRVKTAPSTARPNNDDDEKQKAKRLQDAQDTQDAQDAQDTQDTQDMPPKTRRDRAANLQARKLKSFSAYASQSPFPDLARPTPRECRLAHGILARLHGDRVRPDKVVAPTGAAGCGNSPSVLDALVRTILSQNTSDANSSRAKRSMDHVYGGSDRWQAIVDGGQSRLQKAIQSGGLSVVKSRVIIGILQQVKARYGVYSLDHLFGASDEDAMREMLSFQGVGPKTASCVLLFCLRRASFAVDTHVYRLTGLLGWRPPAASREEAQAHLDAMIPPEEKYPLHVLLISHGKKCAECRAGGKSLGQCELRSAFRRGRLEGDTGGISEDMRGQDAKVEDMREGGMREDMKQEDMREDMKQEDMKQEDMKQEDMTEADMEGVKEEDLAMVRNEVMESGGEDN